MEVEDPSRSRPLKSILKLAFTSTSPVIKRLVSLRHKGVEEKWAETAVKILARKLRSRGEELEELERALRDPDRPSNCVTIPRNSDQGRLSVWRRKNHAHVIYCKLWRWPELLWYGEILPTEYCKFPFDAKATTDVCVNPYHYRRLEDPVLSVLVPRSPDFAASERNAETEDRLDVNGYLPAPRNVEAGYTTEVEWLNQRNEHGMARSTEEPAQAQPSNLENARPVSYQEQQQWASIAYYEFNHRIGEIFHCSRPTVTVDGFTDPSSERFCLGKMSNVNRTSVIENVRRHIGNGVRFHYVKGELYAECLSDSAIFVQSKNRNYEANFHPFTVIKMPPGCAIKIFDNKVFCEVLKRSVNDGFESTYELTKMCTIRMSFVKGWGAEYHRQDVTSTPCWIEIHLNGPLRWLDDVLKNMGNSQHFVSSVS